MGTILALLWIVTYISDILHGHVILPQCQRINPEEYASQNLRNPLISDNNKNELQENRVHILRNINGKPYVVIGIEIELLLIRMVHR